MDDQSNQVCTRARVRYAETDKMGVVYYANYLIWFEVGRTEWLRHSGLTYRELEEVGFVLPVIEAHCEYLQPVRYDDEVEIRTRGTLISGVRVRFDYEIVRRAHGIVAAVGRTVHASVNPAGRPRRLPVQVRQLFGWADESRSGGD
jgi:acyl-CoA thioester hydrolase